MALLQVSGGQPEHVTIIGMVSHSPENKLGLGPQAEAGIEDMVQMLVDKLENSGLK